MEHSENVENRTGLSNVDKHKKHRSKRYFKLSLVGWLLVLPYIIWNIIFWIYPNVVSIPISLFDASVISPKVTFVGLKNFIDFFTSVEFKAIMNNLLRFSIFYVPVSICVCLFIAVMLNTVKNLAIRSVIAISLFLPNLTSSVAYSVIFQKIFDPNSFLTKTIQAIFGVKIGWFSDPNIVLIPIAIMIVWKSAGYYALILYASLANIPKSYNEAALIDGAGPFTRFFKITLPVINPTFLVVVIFSVTTFFAIFGEPYILTGGGGPLFASYTFKLAQFHQIYERLAIGMGSAVSIVAGTFSYLLVLAIKKLVSREV